MFFRFLSYIGFLVLSVAVVWLSVRLYKQISPAVQTLIAGVIGVLGTKLYEVLKEREGKLYEKRRDVYIGLLKPYEKLFTEIGEKIIRIDKADVKPENETGVNGEGIGERWVNLKGRLNDISFSVSSYNFEAILYASDKVIEEYIKFKWLFEDDDSEKVKSIFKDEDGEDMTVLVMILQLGYLMQAMRRDVGYPYTRLSNFDMVGTFMNITDRDIDLMKKKLAQRLMSKM